MARGWESNSAEEETDRRLEERAEARKGTDDSMSPAEAARARTRRLLELKRERILSEKASHPIRRQALLAALKEIEDQLRQLD